jgi:hypothetical protein
VEVQTLAVSLHESSDLTVAVTLAIVWWPSGLDGFGGRGWPAVVLDVLLQPASHNLEMVLCLKGVLTFAGRPVSRGSGGGAGCGG